jgi:hypothetical protein
MYLNHAAGLSLRLSLQAGCVRRAHASAVLFKEHPLSLPGAATRGRDDKKIIFFSKKQKNSSLHALSPEYPKQIKGKFLIEVN